MGENRGERADEWASVDVVATRRRRGIVHTYARARAVHLFYGGKNIGGRQGG